MKSYIKSLIYFIFSPFLIMKGKKDAVYITFDDGPHLVNTLKILEVLKAAKVKATFFMVGEDMDKFPDTVKAVKNDGHSIGYHSFSHQSLKKISLKNVISDIRKVKYLEFAHDIRINKYRPPYGDLTIMSVVWLVINRLKIIMWSLDSRDSYSDKDIVLMNVHPDNVGEGEILLFHDDYDLTVEILPEVLTRFADYNVKCKKL